MKGRTKTTDKKIKSNEIKLPVAKIVKEEKKKAKALVKEDIATQLKADVKNINDNLMKEGERLFFTRIPEKIIELTEYMQNQPLFKKHFQDVRQEISVDKYVLAYMAERKEKTLLRYVSETHKSYDDWRKAHKHLNVSADVEKEFKEIQSHKQKKQHKDKDKDKSNDSPIPFPPDCIIPINENLYDMLEYLKKEVKECVVLCSSIKMWITLKIPRMEDGNNFGVAIQEECVDTIADVEDEAYSVLDSISNYHTTRGNYIVQMVTNPSVMDYAKCITQVDETQFFNTRLSIQSFRNNYALLYDLVTKNLEKLQTPTTHTDLSSFY